MAFQHVDPVHMNQGPLLVQDLNVLALNQGMDLNLNKPAQDQDVN